MLETGLLIACMLFYSGIYSILLLEPYVDFIIPTKSDICSSYVAIILLMPWNPL